MAQWTRHSSIPLVKPVRTFRCRLCLLLLATVWVGEVEAQTSSTSHRSVRQSERVARASWRPTREGESTAASGRVVRVQHADEQNGNPLPPPVSVIQTPVPEASLDGQVRLAPLHDSLVACDALPASECGCGAEVCTGCDLGCDSPGSCGGSCPSGDCATCGELCSPQAWRPCITLCTPQDGWVSFEYLGWWQDGMALPPLLTSSSDPNVARTEAGVLGSPTTQILFGGDDVLDDAFDGGRLRFGLWLDRRHTWAVGAEYFELSSETDSFSAASTGNPILARPFFNTQTGVEDASLIAFPNVLSGSVGISATSELTGAAVNFRHLRNCDQGCGKWLFCGCPDHFCSRTEMLIGYRFLELEESVLISENEVSTDPNNPGNFDIFDRFQTRSQFNGFDIGWTYRRTRGYWTVDTLLRLGVGNTRQTVTISGQTTIDDPNNQPVQTLPGGILAQTSNIGTFQQDEFTVVPEFNANLGYQLTDHLRLTLGYTFIYWSNVVRPGEHISRDLNPNLLPPPANPLTGAQRPAFAFDTTDYWVQGINFGGEIRW